MRDETFKSLVGKPVKDFYGREAGRVVGLYVDNLGQLKSVGVDEGHGNLLEHPSKNIIFDDGSIVIVPNWRVDIDKFRKENETAQRRAKALDELMKEGEITKNVYEDLCQQYDGQASSLRDSYVDLVNVLKVRVQEMDARKETLEKFLVNMKIQYKTGEIDAEIYQVTAEHVTTMQKRDLTEKEDVLNILRSTEIREDKQDLEADEMEPQEPVEETEVQTITSD